MRRASPNRVRYTSNPIGQQSVFERGGSVHDNALIFAREAENLARQICPVRSGELRNAHDSFATNEGYHRCRLVVFNEAPHAKYVMYGTQGPIRSTRYAVGGYMIVRPAPHSFYSRPTPRAEVNGQDPNNWIKRAVHLVLASHGIAF